MANTAASLSSAPTPEPARVLVMQSGEKLGTAVHDFLKAKSFEVQVVDKAEEVLAALSADHPPSLLVLDLFQPRSVATVLRQKLQAPELRKVATLFVTKKAETKEYHQRAAEFPRSRLVAGSGRLVVRVLEMLSGMLGLDLPRCERVQVEVEGVLRSRTGTRRIPVRTQNVSDSGVKVFASAGLDVDSEWELTLELRNQKLIVPVQVVRTFLDRASGQWQTGLRFTKLSQEMQTLLDRLIESTPELAPPAKEEYSYQGHPVRSAVRLALPARLGVKAKLGPPEAKTRAYLQVVDVSERGFRARWHSEKKPPFEVDMGQVLDSTLLWPGHSVVTQSEIVWFERREKFLELGFRFWNLPRTSRRGLSRLLFAVMERGIKGSDVPLRPAALDKDKKNKRKPKRRAPARASAS